MQDRVTPMTEDDKLAQELAELERAGLLLPRSVRKPRSRPNRPTTTAERMGKTAPYFPVELSARDRRRKDAALSKPAAYRGAVGGFNFGKDE